MLVEPPAPLLPATLGKLTRTAEGNSGDGLETVDPAQKPILMEDGLRRYAQSDYTVGPNGPSRGTITAYKFMDVSGAISAYDYLRKPGMRPEKIGDSAVSNADELIFRSGPDVVIEHLKLGRDETAAVNTELIQHLPKALGPASLAPLLPSLLPAKGLDVESAHYALGPTGYQAMGGIVPAQSVGFDKSAEVVTAKYKGGGTLTLVLYPTPQIAGDHGRAIETALNGVSTGTMKLRREGPLVALTTGAWNPAIAQKLIDGIHMRTEVSFDKPLPLDFHTEVKKTYTLLQSIAIFCGLGALAAVVLGFSLGGVRALVRVMQGKPAATEPEFLRIDLRDIGPKPLKRS